MGQFTYKTLSTATTSHLALSEMSHDFKLKEMLLIKSISHWL
jgi:hypothetical protein